MCIKSILYSVSIINENVDPKNNIIKFVALRCLFNTVHFIFNSIDNLTENSLLQPHLLKNHCLGNI